MSMINVLFMGRKQVAASCLEWLLSLSPAVNIVGVVTDSHLDSSVTASVALASNLQLLTYEEAANLCATVQVDLGVSLLYWRKLKGPLLLSDSKFGCINFHPAILPDYKGCAGYNLAILDQLTHWATSCHFVDESIDTGPIIDVLRFPIGHLETALSLEKKTLQYMELQFKRIISTILLTSTAPPADIPNLGGRYVSRQEMEALKRILPTDDPELKARAFYFPPYDGAWIEVNGSRLNVIPTSVLRSLASPNSSNLFSNPAENAHLHSS